MFGQTIASQLEGERPVVVVERDEDVAVQAKREGHPVVRIGEQIDESTARRAGADILVVPEGWEDVEDCDDAGVARPSFETTTRAPAQGAAMEKYVLWFARLGRFYQILVALAVFFGLAAVGTGVGTGNPAFLAVGAFWLLVAPAAVWLVSRDGGPAEPGQ